ncbi:MAG: ABC transporter permease [Acidimicrobiales bacterium]
MKLGPDVLVLGGIQGLLYGMLAIGLVLVYKAQRFVNFAQANLGLIASVLIGKLVVDAHLPYVVALVPALAAGVGLSALIELTVVRRLFKAPRLVLMVASIFLAQLLLIPRLIKGINANSTVLATKGFPEPFHARFSIGRLVINTPDILIVVVVSAVVIALAAFFRYSPYGQAIRAASENPDAARLAGISVKRMSTLVWLIAGLISSIAAILNAPRAGVFILGGSGASILVRALGAALVARMTNLPVAFGAGVAVGVIEAVTFANVPAGGSVELVVFLIVMGALLVRSRELSRATRDSAANVNFGVEARALSRSVLGMPEVKALRFGSAALGLGTAVALPYLPFLGLNTSSKTFLFTLVTGYVMVGLSLCVLSGWGGQVSLGQYALVGVGSFAASRLGAGGGIPFWLAIPLAGIIGAVVAIVVGLPAIRIQGLFLAVATLAFAVVAQGWAFTKTAIVNHPEGAFLTRPEFLTTDRSIYFVGLFLITVFALSLRSFRASGPGRMLIAVRDNDRAARADGISAVGARLVGFALAGFMAACAGVVFAYARQRFQSTDFSPDLSFQMLTMVIVGGLGSIPGAILGGVFIFGVPILFRGTDAFGVAQLLVSGLGGLVFLLFIPRGLAGAMYTVRDAVIGRIVRRRAGLPAPPKIVPPLRELYRVAVGRPAT